MKNMKLKNNTGLTLVEVMITALLLSIGILNCLLYFTAANASTDLSRDMVTATTHAEHVLEEMRTLSTLSDITNTDWDAWVATNNLDTLNNETVSVTYANAAADPLNVTVAIDWDTNNKSNTISLVTELTK